MFVVTFYFFLMSFASYLVCSHMELTNYFIYFFRMPITNIQDLKPGTTNAVIEAKVYRAWTARDPPSIVEKGYRAILLDRQVS